MKTLCYNKEWITSKNEKHNFNKLTMIKIRFRDKKKMWRKRGSAKSNPRNSERCKSETARKHQNASKIQITRTQKKNTYRYEI